MLGEERVKRDYDPESNAHLQLLILLLEQCIEQAQWLGTTPESERLETALREGATYVAKVVKASSEN